MSYPNVRIKSVSTDAIEIDPAVLVGVPSNLAGFAAQRTCGEFSRKALYLSDVYIWVFGFDDAGALIAVPTRRN